MRLLKNVRCVTGQRGLCGQDGRVRLARQQTAEELAPAIVRRPVSRLATQGGGTNPLSNESSFERAGRQAGQTE